MEARAAPVELDEEAFALVRVEVDDLEEELLRFALGGHASGAFP
jgi:hypothetical protein